MTESTRTERETFLILHDLRRQLPLTRGPLRRATERAIERLEWELAPGRAAEAASAATASTSTRGRADDRAAAGRRRRADLTATRPARKEGGRMKTGLRICAAAGCGVVLGAAAPGDRCGDCFRAGRPAVTRPRPIGPRGDRPRARDVEIVVYPSRTASVTQTAVTAAEALRRGADREAERQECQKNATEEEGQLASFKPGSGPDTVRFDSKTQMAA